MRQGTRTAIAVGLTAAGLLTGCATTARVGTPPRTDALKDLTVGVSTVEGVVRALGEPRGTGAARASAVPEPRKLLYYEYTEVEGSRIGLKLLLVFIRQDRYDGHLWFSAAQLVEEARR